MHDARRRGADVDPSLPFQARGGGQSSSQCRSIRSTQVEGVHTTNVPRGRAGKVVGDIKVVPVYDWVPGEELSNVVLRQAKPGEGDGVLHGAPKPSVRPGGSRIPPGKGWPPAGTECCVVYG